MAVFATGQFGLNTFIEGLIGAHQIFRAVRQPLHGPAQQPRQNTDQHFFAV